MKKILPFEGQLDLTTSAADAGDDVEDTIQKLDMAMQVCTAVLGAMVVWCGDLLQTRKVVPAPVVVIFNFS